ncbi:MAG: HK97 family phage prohead protease [Colwellia sp.]|nr:HK97 family phage prohead protease [Colwellia sp.]
MTATVRVMMMMRFKREICQVSKFKFDEVSGSFTCYGNTKGNVDHALDRTVDGAYQGSIDKHKAEGTMPKMFWMHQSHGLPVGPWTDMEEDNKGLKMSGKLSKTSMGNDIIVLAKDKALDSFSIGYNVIRESWNSDKGCNDLIEIDIKEVSWVNFACNEESMLVAIKDRLGNGEFISKADLRVLLGQIPDGLSKRQIERITSDYNPDIEPSIEEKIEELLASSILFK